MIAPDNASAPPTRTLLLGLGNPILRDDAVGLVVARALHARLLAVGLDVDLAEASTASLDLLPIVADFASVVISDAVLVSAPQPGRVHRYDLRETPGQRTLTSLHGVGPGTALEFGRRLGLPVPPRVVAYGIEVLDPYSFDEAMSPELVAAVPGVVHAILAAEFPTAAAPPPVV